MSSISKYPGKKVLIPTMLTEAAAALLIGLGNSSLSAGQATSNSSIQNNVGISTSQPPYSPDNASDYFVLQSQQEL
jgi:hypothetical protein